MFQMIPRPIRSIAHRLPPRRRRPHRALQLAVRAPARRRVRAAHRRHRRRAVVGRRWSKASSTACAGSGSTGTKARRSAARTRPYFQSERLDRYRAMAARLVDAGRARTTATARPRNSSQARAARKRRTAWRYDRTCCALTADEIASPRSATACRAPSAFASPTGTTRFDDLVHGPIEFDGANIEDFVILRSDGHPTYQLSVVVRRCGDGDHACGARRRSHLEHAEADAAVSGASAPTCRSSRTCR